MTTMTTEQEQHLEHIIATVSSLLREKYTKGAEEHDGDLLHMTARQLLHESLMEKLDDFVYTLTALSKLPDDVDNSL